MTETIYVPWYEKYKVTVPEGQFGSVKIEKFTVTEDGSRWSYLKSAGRGVTPGDYTKLMRNGYLWMSDTPSEIRDHRYAISKIEDGARRVLIHGLGLGLVLQAALLTESVSEVDVVEIDSEVIELVGPHYQKMAFDNKVELRIHHDDALTKKWPPGSRWDVVWHDNWSDICVDNLKEMTKLKRSFGRRAGWQGCWSEELCRWHRDR